MAIRYAVASGNWSSTATWDGGTLPTAADDVHANNRTVTLDQDVTVLSLRTTAGGAAVAGGNFNTPTSGTRNITANIISGSGGVQVLGTCNCTINGNITGSATTTNTRGVYIARLGASFYNLSDLPTATINGNLLGGSVGAAEAVRLDGGKLTINGSITGGTAGNGCTALVLFNSELKPFDVTVNTGPVTGGSSSGNDACGIAVQTSIPGIARSNCILRVNCNVIGGTIASRNRGILTQIPTTITGNVTGGFASAIVVGAFETPVSITGNVTAGAGGHGVENTATYSNLTIIGNVTGGSANNTWGVYNERSSVTITGNVYGGTAGSEPYGVNNNSSGIVTIYGDCYGGTGGTATVAGVRNNASGIVNVYGNAYGATTGTATNPGGVVNTSSGVVNIFGTAQAGSLANAYGVRNFGDGIVRVKRAKGNAYGVGSVGVGIAYGVQSDSQGGVTFVEEIEFGSRGANPVIGQIFLTPVSTNVAVVTLVSSSQKTLYDASSVAGVFPATSDVRSGVSYNAGNNVGTCSVPSANSVSAGVAVDATTGSATLSPANVWDYTGSSVAGSTAEKLRKTAIPADIIALS